MTPLTPRGQALVNRIPHYSRAVIEVERQAADRALAELRVFASGNLSEPEYREFRRVTDAYERAALIKPEEGA